MTLSEKVAYLRGLEEGLNLKEERPETKLLSAIVDTIEAIAESTNALEENLGETQAQLDEVDMDLSDLEGFLAEEEEDDEADEMYEVTCPKCGETIYVDEGVLEEGGIECPKCGEELEFEIELDDGDLYEAETSTEA